MTVGFAILIVGTAIATLRMTRPGGRFGQFRPRRRGERATAGGQGEQPFRIGKAERNDINSQEESVTFKDVAGLDEAIMELQEVVDYLRAPERYQLLGAELPRGVLLYGLPGCGKTLLARAVAGETGVPFFFVSATAFVEKFVGLGAARVRQLFEQAKAQSPCIIFIDELDAIGRHRNAESTGDREFDNTLNQLLVELDGFAGNTGVMIIGATNRPELIDAALLRPGRFDRRIQVDRPDREGREQILLLHAGRRPISRRVDWSDIAASTAGLNAAELANIVNESCLLAARRHRDRVTPEDVDEACSRVLAGARSARLMTDEEKELISVHEAGHALLSLLLRGVKPPSRVSIVSRGSAFGRSPWSSSDDREVLTKRELMAQLIVLLGGRAAEMNTFGQPSTRSEDDLEHAATLARRMVERLAMTGRFDLADHKGKDDDGDGAKEVRELLLRAEQAARTILGDNADDLRRIAEALTEKETLSAAEISMLTTTRRRGPLLQQAKDAQADIGQ
ncbi:MAG: cell division protease FtsH [Actinomycetota bacterium]|nr:cell division protease FtsH [Actinomycetota bacterium]